MEEKNYESAVSQTSKGHTWMQWAVAIIASIAPLTYGLQCGWVSPMTKILQSNESPVGRPLNDTELSLIAALPSLAAAVGILVVLYVVDKFGRKPAIFLISVFQLISWIITVCPASPISLLIARLFCGLGAGSCYHVVPMYIKEISQDNIRGTLGAMAIFLQNLGILGMYALGAYLDYYTVLYLVTGLPLINIVMMCKCPESPSFLVKMGKFEEATKHIALLRGLKVTDIRVQTEIDAIKKEDEYFKYIPNISFLNIFREKAWRRGFLIMTAIITIQALNGVFAITMYATMILANSEMNISPELQSLGIPLCLTLGTFFTMASVDRLGRKVILGTTFGLSMLALWALASSIWLNNDGWVTPKWLPIVAILCVVFCYGSGISPIPYIVMSEMFNFQIRAKLMACLCILAWFWSFFQLTGFIAVTNSLGAHTSFFIFGGINLLGTVIVITMLPETGGKSIEQIENKLRKEKSSDDKSCNNL